MSKSLKAIQVIVKVAKILATIVFVCSIIGGAGCLVGLITFVAGKGLMIPMLEEYSELTWADGMFACISGLLVCACDGVLAKFTMLYCDHELKAGTPFTHDGAKEILRLGILSLAIPAGVSFVLGVTFGILKIVLPEISDTVDTSISLTTGLALIAMSLVFRYGAEFSERAEKQTDSEKCPQELEETK